MWELEKMIDESRKFDKSAFVYDKYRPSYPKEIINDIITISGIKDNAKILEVGAGSGKATELFVARGYHLTCIEQGENLAQRGIERFKETGKVEYIISRFEEVDEFSEQFDLAICAQAFHWIQKPVGYEKLAKALKPNSYCALFWNKYMNDGSELSSELSRVCKEYGVLYMLEHDELIERSKVDIDEIENSGYFKNTRFIELPWKVEQSCEEFINFLSTGNGYIGMEEGLRLELGNKLKKIFDKADGKITRHFNCISYISQKS